MSEKKLFLLDGMALIYRAFFAFSKNHRYNSKGLNTSAMFGFTMTLLEVLQKEKPTHIAVVFDTSAPTDRHIMFPDYKAHREAMPEALSASIPYIFQIIEGFHIPVITKDGYEADDIIGTLALEAVNKGFETFMMTPDKDFAQLVRDKVYIYKPARMGLGHTIMDVEAVKQKWEIKEPTQVIDILALWGDASDNIPGIPGIGEKTAKKLIEEFGSVENLIANTDKLKGSIQDKVREHHEKAIISKKLATINTQVPVEFDENALNLDPPDKQKLEAIFKELEFRTLAQKILGPAPQQPTQHDLFSSMAHEVVTPEHEELVKIFSSFDSNKQKYTLIDSLDDLQDLVNKIKLMDAFCFDTETDGLDPIDSNIIGLSLSVRKNEGFFINLNREDKKDFVKILQPLFESTKLKIAQNLKFDLMILKKAGVEITQPYYDTMIAHFLLDPDKRHNMDELSRTFLQYDPISIETLIGKKGKDQLKMTSVPLEDLTRYAAEDADITLQLQQKLNPLIIEKDLTTVFETVELPLIPVLASMELSGVKVDKAFLNNYSKELAVDIVVTEKKIFELAGVAFNIASPKQMGEVLFDKLKLAEKPKKTKTGQYQTNEEVLVKLAHTHEIVNHILDYRELVKLKSTYVDALPLLIKESTGRIHTSFNQAVVGTGRLSSNNPNLQNIPIRTEKGREIRKAFVAPSKEYVLMSADYSQIELRVIASMSGDEHMIEAFNNGLDIHASTASKVFGVPYEQVSKEMRRKAKTVNFGIIYGISAFGLSERIGIPRKEAQHIINEYFEKFPKIKSYMDNTIALAQKEGYVKTILGRRRYIADINSRNQTIKGFAERNAINAPIQGSAADMIKLAMINIEREISKSRLNTKMILQVHDELLFEVPKSEVEQTQVLVKYQMENAMKLNVPILVEVGIGDNWLEAH
ncbi:MAG: DNA polymerase I [Bacteroidia bacterium]|nr:DNA polymerase I [Bacteroidota bacterium]MCZ2130259.1 DNA polymerase I [Bacteroidia bacterium]